MTRIIGASKSRRRRGFVLVSMLAAVSVALFITASSFSSVHDVGVFQLDGNAQQSVAPAGIAGDDWDNICTPLGGGCIGDGPQASHRTASTFDPDLTGTLPPVESQNATIFTTGGSKDELDIDGWSWKDSSGGLPDKDNLQHAYSARYSYETTLTAAVTTATQTTLTAPNRTTWFPETP